MLKFNKEYYIINKYNFKVSIILSGDDIIILNNKLYNYKQYFIIIQYLNYNLNTNILIQYEELNKYNTNTILLHKNSFKILNIKINNITILEEYYTITDPNNII